MKAKKKRNPKGTNPVGRPRKVLTEELKKSIILGLSLGCTVAEVSASTDVSVSVLYANFRKVIKTGNDSFKCNLKKAQAKRAFGGSDTMLIWLGKQYLNQKDKHETAVELTGKDGGPVKSENKTIMTTQEIEDELKKRGLPVPEIGGEDL